MKGKFLLVALLGAFAAGCVAQKELPQDSESPSESISESTSESSSEGHVHSYTLLKHSDIEHWYECACGEEQANGRAAHGGGEATCENLAACAVCGRAYGEKLAHRSSGKATETVAEACLDCGYVIAPATGYLTHTLIYHTGGGSDLPIATGTTQALQSLILPTPEKEGYAFVGWYLDEGCTQAYSAAALVGAFVELYAKYTPIEYTVRVQFSHRNGCIYAGELEQTVSRERPFSAVTVTPALGYTLEGYEIDGVQYLSNVIEVPAMDKDVTVNVLLDYATYELPIVNIAASGEITSKEEYVEMQFTLGNCDGELENIAGGIRLRGNSTMYFEKKPYRIKFDKKQSLFGLEKAKSWVLLADYLNPSGLRNYAAFTLGKEADGLSFTPSPHKVNLYLDGEFLGLYTLCEQVQENKGRMDIEMDTGDSDFLPDTLTSISDYNFFLCLDDKCKGDAGAAEGLTYIAYTLGEYERIYEMKYPEKGLFSTDEQFENYVTQLRAYIGALYTILKEGSLEEVQNAVDVSSLIDYYLVDAILLERDHSSASFNMYYTANTGKLHFGPIWDYDTSIYSQYTGVPNEILDLEQIDVTEIAYTNEFFEVIERFPELQEMVKHRYNELFKGVLDEFIEGYDLLTYQMRESLRLNNERWYASYDYDLTAENVAFLEKYLRARKEFLDEHWKLTTGV